MVLHYLVSHLHGFGIQHILPAHFAHQIVIALVAFPGSTHRVAHRVVEHNGIIAFHLAQPTVAVVRHFRPFKIRLHLSVGEGQYIMHQRHTKGRHRHTGSVSQLRHQQIVARQQRPFHGARRYGIEFQHFAAYYHSRNQCKDYGIHPVAQFAHLVGRLLSGVVILHLVQPQERQVNPRENHCKSLLPKTVSVERLGRLHHQQQEHKHIDCGNKEIDIPHLPLSALLYPNHYIINWNKGFPRSHSHLLEHKP